MNKKSFALIMATAVLVLCLLSPFAGAVTISYTADSGGESVSISENYDIDNTVTVKETTDISFGNLLVDQERTAEGTGEADLKQTISGKSVDGTGYVAENGILSEGTINAKTYTSATGTTLGVAQTVSVTGDAELLLEGEEGGNMAGQSAIVENGILNLKQTLDIGNGVRASLYASIWGDLGAAIAMAEDADGNLAGTWVFMENGELSTKQEAEADGCATTGQESNVDAEWGYARSWAGDADGNLADTWVFMENGTLSTKQEAEADGSAKAAEKSQASGTSIWLYNLAWNQYGNTNIRNDVTAGTLDSESEAIANEDEAFCSQDMAATGQNIDVNADAHNLDPTIPDASATMSDSETLSTHTTATVTEADAEATIVEWLGCP